MQKRIISLLLAVVLIVSMLPGTIVSAATTESTAVLTVEEPWANPGGTVDVNIVITENPGVLGATLVVSWDESLTLVSDASGEAFSHMTYTSPSRYTASGTNFVWFGNEVGEAMDGIVLTLTFEVPDTAENNEILPIWVTYTPGDVVDGNDNDVTFSITDGYVRVITYKPGDVNGDTRVNSRDLVRLSQYISDGNKTDPEGYNAEVVADACDVNGDGRVNARDLIRLSQYVSDGSQTDPEGYNAVLNPAKLPQCAHADMAVTEAKTPSCTEEGNIAYWYCADCAKYFSNAEATNEIAYIDTVISATGHTEAVDLPVEPSCFETGLTEGSHCTVCNEVLVAQEKVEMTNHTPGAQATCTEDQACVVCGETLVTANGHIPGVEASCTEPQHCTVCQTVLVEATGHILTYVAEQDPAGGKEAADCVPGNCAYWKCSICNKCYLDENATQEIALADTAWKIYKVYFFDLENDTYTVGAYKQSEVLSLKTVFPDEMKGYDFNSWHTSENFTEQNKISVIPAGNTENVNLYANRSLHEYKITLLGLGREESWTYNIVNGIKLTTPRWKASAGEGDCLIFSHWSDENGDKITDIPAGEIGDRTIEANWIYKENYAVSNPDKYTYVNGYQNHDGKYSFIYEIGSIKNLVLSKQHNYSFDGLTEHTESETKTYTVGVETGQELAETVSKIVSSSSEMSNIETNTTTHTDGWEVGAKWKPEIEYAGIKASAWEFSGGYSNSDAEIYENTGFTSENNYEEDGTENELRSTIDFYTEEVTSRTVSDTFTPGVTPIGNYTWARLMDVKVYGIVTYNPYTGKYVFDIYSVPCNVHDGLLYTLPSELEYEVNIVSGDVLDFEIPFTNIPEMFYTVEYNANGGTGEMPKSIHELGSYNALWANEFSKTGYSFVGWKTSTENSTAIYTDKQIVGDIAAAGETVTLYAQWAKIDYTVQYNANKPANASSSVLDVPVNMACSYDTAITLGGAPSLYGWTFEGWYRDAACKVRVGGADETVDKANLTTVQGETVLLYANWIADSYTITYDANGGTGTTETSTHAYDTSSPLSANGFTRAEYTFLGWSTDSDAITPIYTNKQAIKNLATSGNVALYAVWVKTSATIYFTPDNDRSDLTFSEGDTHTERVNTNMLISDLVKNGYGKVTISVSFDCKSNDAWFMYNSGTLNVVAQNKNLYSGSWHLKDNMSGSWETKTVTFTCDLTKLNEDASFDLVWAQPWGTGNWETWYVGSTVVTVTAKK